MAGLRVCIVGDVLHSRVARSNINILQTLGAEVAVCAPPTLLPLGIAERNVRVFRRIDEAVEWANVLNVLRIQAERMQQGLFPSFEEFSRYFGLRYEHLEKHPDLLVLHPGPINRGVEIGSEAADAPQSLILSQVEHGVAMRMALLALIARNRRAGV
jgi:aspartate carbamoyltransferase catalytic subunit